MKHTVLYSVQYLRAAAALAVFYYHISATVHSLYGPNKVTIDEVGAAGVDLFFVISGFIMAMIVWDKQVQGLDFFIRRVVRVVPLYWGATLFVFAIAMFMPSLLGSTGTDYAQLIHSLLFIPYGMNPESSAPVLLVGWTLNYEMFFYVLVALFAGCFSDRRLLKLSAFLVTIVSLGYAIGPENRYLAFYVDPIVLEFVLGIAVFHLWQRTKDQPQPLLYGSLFTAMIVVFGLQFEVSPDPYRVVFWGLPSAVLLLSGLHVLTLKSEFLRKMGDWSYALYILHLFVIMGFLKVILPQTDSLGLPWWAGYALMTIILVGASWIVHLIFEKPSQIWLQNLLLGMKANNVPAKPIPVPNR